MNHKINLILLRFWIYLLFRSKIFCRIRIPINSSIRSSIQISIRLLALRGVTHAPGGGAGRGGWRALAPRANPSNHASEQNIPNHMENFKKCNPDKSIWRENICQLCFGIFLPWFRSVLYILNVKIYWKTIQEIMRFVLRNFPSRQEKSAHPLLVSEKYKNM